jgi:hypothetical protein
VRQSEVAKQFKNLPKEVQFSFFDSEEKRNVKHFSKTYQNFMYIRKVLKLHELEVKDKFNLINTIYDVKTLEDLRLYFFNNNQRYLWEQIRALNLEDELLTHVKTLKPYNFDYDIQSQTQQLKDVYEEYNLDHEVLTYVDDLGTLHNTMTVSAISKGFKGNERHAANTSIQITKDVNTREEVEEKASSWKDKLIGMKEKFS